jgi:hypothetical protein
MRSAPTGAAAGPAPRFVTQCQGALPGGASPEYDVVVCGGTLGVVVGAALARRGRKVAVLERGPLRGRAQDWNLSRVELEALVREGVMSPEERDAAITAEFNPGRCAFHGHGSVEVRDVLNLGVSPDVVVTAARRALEAAGGVVVENTGCDALDVYDNGCRLALAGAAAPGPALTARLVLDCMGHASPVVRQARWGRRPDGVCLVVGSCARGFDAAANVGGDVIATVGPMERGADGLAQQLHIVGRRQLQHAHRLLQARRKRRLGTSGLAQARCKLEGRNHRSHTSVGAAPCGNDRREQAPEGLPQAPCRKRPVGTSREV